MPSVSMIRTRALQGACEILAVIEHLVRPEDRRDAIEAFADVLKTLLEGFAEDLERMERRLRPIVPSEN